MTEQPIENFGRSAAWVSTIARVAPAAALMVVVAGCVLQIVHFLGGRSLWIDEAMVALNIVYLPVDQLLGQLKFDQLAPLGWLVLQKGLFTLWGDFDYSLRLTSVVFGIGSLLCFWKLAQKALDPETALVAIGLFVISPPLIQYAAMVKPYIVDVFFSVVLTYIALRLLDGAPRTAVWTFMLGVVGLCAITLSFPAISVMAPIGVVLFSRGLAARDYRWLAMLALIGATWLGLFAGLYFGFYAPMTTTIDKMQNIYWSSTFAPLLPRTLGELAWYPRSIANVTGWLLSFPGTVISGLALLAGGFAIARSRPWLFALLAGPIVTAVVVSAARAYPFESRFILYLAPQFLILLAAGITFIARQCRAYWAAMALVFLAVGGSALAQTARSTLSRPPWPIEEIKPNLAHIAERAAMADTIFVNRFGERAFLLYAPRYGLESRDYLVGSWYRETHNCVYADVEALRRRAGPSWVVIYHIGPGDAEPTGLFLHMLGEVGDLKLVQGLRGSWLYRFEPNRDAGVVLPKPDQACFTDRQERLFLEEVAAANGSGKPIQSAGP